MGRSKIDSVGIRQNDGEAKRETAEAPNIRRPVQRQPTGLDSLSLRRNYKVQMSRESRKGRNENVEQ